jgi:hypothetical protein
VDHEGDLQERQWLTLTTKTNYMDWAVIMHVQLQVHGLWDAVNEGNGDDRASLATVLWAMSPEFLCTLAAKDNAKTSWDTIKTPRIRDKRVRQAKAQTGHRDYDRLRFKDGETVEEFVLWLSVIVNDLATLGDPVDKYKAVRKFLRVVPRKCL